MVHVFCFGSNNLEAPSTQNLRLLIPKAMKGVVFWNQKPEKLSTWTLGAMYGTYSPSVALAVFWLSLRSSKARFAVNPRPSLFAALCGRLPGLDWRAGRA